MIYVIENINPFSLRFYYYLLWKNKAHRFRLHDFVIVWLWYRPDGHQQQAWIEAQRTTE